MATDVVIEEKPFMAIFIAAVEAYPSKFNGRRKVRGTTPEGEIHGLLFGQRKQKRNGTIIYTVTLAIPNQIVLERTADSTSVACRHIERIRKAVELFPGYELLGFFHSHPYPKSDFNKIKSVEPSETDKEDALAFAEKEETEILDLIFAITCQERRTKATKEAPKPYIIHSGIGAYKYTMACYRAVVDVDKNEYTYAVSNNLSSI